MMNMLCAAGHVPVPSTGGGGETAETGLQSIPAWGILPGYDYTPYGYIMQAVFGRSFQEKKIVSDTIRKDDRRQDTVNESRYGCLGKGRVSGGMKTAETYSLKKALILGMEVRPRS